MKRVVALSGGVGGAKLSLGLYRLLPAQTLTLIVNTGDDFEHLGLRICPDVDTTLYTLANLANTELGWGRREETWTFLQTLASLGGETWFRLGDGDLALHAYRTQRLRQGDSLSAIIAAVAGQWNIHAQIAPMSDDLVQTRVLTEEGDLGFQDYFVRRRCEPAIRSLDFRFAATARASAAALAALHDPAVHAIVICPSNPYLSIDPILAIPELRAALRNAKAPVIAVSPLVGGAAVKGPTAKIMNELGVPLSAASIAAHYRDIIDGFVLDSRDRAAEKDITAAVLIADTLMLTLADRERLARETLEFALKVPKRSKPDPNAATEPSISPL
jgi:LPPG:FO 2-phospho-L-lactate transferase